MSILLFKNPVSGMGMLGYSITIMGVVAYSEAKKRSKEKLRRREDLELLSSQANGSAGRRWARWSEDALGEKNTRGHATPKTRVATATLVSLRGDARTGRV